MEKSEDFLRLMADEIRAKGIVVIEKVERMPVYGEPYVSPFFIIGINHRGTISLQYDGLETVFRPKDISVVYPNHELFCRNTTPLYKATLIVVSDELFGQVVSINTSQGRFWHETFPHFHLTDSQYNDIMNIVKALQTVQRLEVSSKGVFDVWQLHILTTMIDTFRRENENTPLQQSSNLSPRYYDAIKKHCFEHHDVGFYAGLFCLSPKYFSTIIRQETGHTAGHWLKQYLATQSKIMLRTDKSARLNEVAERLGFPDLATFSRFFRKEFGMSPSEYRQWQRVK